MGLSSNQARFLSLTSRQVDLEQRIQQICQRRLRLSSELENVATTYNNKISNRKMFLFGTTQTQQNQELSLENLAGIGYKIAVTGTDKLLGDSILKKGVETVAAPKIAGQIEIHNTAEFMNMVTQINANNASAVDGNYILMGDIDLSTIPVQSDSLIKNAFTGSIDGNGYTISGLKINESSNKVSDAGSNVHSSIGLFSKLSGDANITNLVLKDFNIASTDSSVTPSNGIGNVYARGNTIGSLAGYVDSSGVVVDNIAVVNTNIAGGACSAAGLIGRLDGGSVTNCSTEGSVSGGHYTSGLVAWVNSGTVDICNADVDVNAQGSWVGGLIGEVYPTGTSVVTRSFATGDVTAQGDCVGGLMGRCIANLQDCYATGAVSGWNNVGGLVGDTFRNINNCYATGSVTGAVGTSGALIGVTASPSTSVSDSFWEGAANGSTATGYHNTGGATYNNVHYIADSSALAIAAAGANWGATVYPSTPLTGNGGSWDTSSTPPKLYVPDGYKIDYTSDMIEDGLRSGKYMLLKDADEYTQDVLKISGDDYEAVDWRTVTQVNDELYQSDDKTAEDKYDKIISEINAQDKKLQLEQTSIEVQYKAITSERESVKKILDTNAQSSFKYFS